MDCLDDVVGLGVFQQKAARPRSERVVDVLVDVERGENEDARTCEQRIRCDVARGVDAVSHRHANVHEHHVGADLLGEVDRLLAVARLARDRKSVVGVEDHAESASHKILVIGDEDAQRLLG